MVLPLKPLSFFEGCLWLVSWIASLDTHLHASCLHIWATDVKGNSDVKLVGHGFPLDQSELTDVVSVVSRVDHICVVQLPSVHQHVVYLHSDRRNIRMVEEIIRNNSLFVVAVKQKCWRKTRQKHHGTF